MQAWKNIEQMGPPVAAGKPPCFFLWKTEKLIFWDVIPTIPILVGSLIIYNTFFNADTNAGGHEQLMNKPGKPICI